MWFLEDRPEDDINGSEFAGQGIEFAKGFILQVLQIRKPFCKY